VQSVQAPRVPVKKRGAEGVLQSAPSLLQGEYHAVQMAAALLAVRHPSSLLP